MIKRILVALLAVASLCMAKVSEPVRAYIPFQLEGLHDNYLNDGFGKYAYAPATVYFNGQFHQFYCSTGARTDNFFNPQGNANLNSSWDHIRHRSSKDGVNWSTPRVVMTVHRDGSGQCACDPSVVYGDDGYWYMLYTANVPGYETVVYLARSNYVQGPYFKYTDKGWENENGMTGTPKIMLGRKRSSEYGGYGVGQQAVVKDPAGNFRVWFVDDRKVRYANVAKLVDLASKKVDNYAEVKLYEGNVKKKFEESEYVMGDVKINANKSSQGKPYFEMWSPVLYMVYETFMAKFSSTNGIDWTLEDKNVLEKGRYRYSYIHNIGVSGDMYGRVRDDKYIISFAAASPRWSANADTALNACSRMEAELFKDDPRIECNGLGWERCLNKYGINCALNLDNESFNIVEHRNGVKKNPDDQNCKDVKQGEICKVCKSAKDCRYYKICRDGIKCEVCKNDPGDKECQAEDMGGNWSMWQVLVGRDWFTNTINYKADGTTFPEGVSSSARLDYFTGDYDGDGITDLGAVNRSVTPNTWFIRSSRTGAYLYKNKKLVRNMNENYEVITGDFDGDGKTDIGAVNKVTGQWYILSSAEGNREGIGSSPELSNWIPWGWQWGGMNSTHKIVVGDYNGDGIADRAIYKAPFWYIIPSSANDDAVANGFLNVSATAYIPWGWYWQWNETEYMDDNDIVLPGDLDGDGITDRVVYETDNGQWSALSSRTGGVLNWHCGRNCSAGQWFSPWQLFRIQISASIMYRNAKPFVGDYDGDGADDLVLVDFSNGLWCIYRSSDHKLGSFDDNPTRWLKLADVAKTGKPEILVGDFDGDGRADRAFVDRNAHKFYVISSRKKGSWGTEGINFEVKSAFANNNSKSWSYFAKSASEKPIEQPKVAPTVTKVPSMNVSVTGRKVSVTDVENGSEVVVFNMLGKKLLGLVAEAGAANFEVPSYGKFVVRSGAQSRVIMVK